MDLTFAYILEIHFLQDPIRFQPNTAKYGESSIKPGQNLLAPNGALQPMLIPVIAFPESDMLSPLSFRAQQKAHNEPDFGPGAGQTVWPEFRISGLYIPSHKQDNKRPVNYAKVFVSPERIVYCIIWHT